MIKTRLWKLKRHSAYRGRKEASARKQYKAWRAQENRSIKHRKKKMIAREQAQDPFYGYVRVTAPQVLSFIHNPESVSNFIDQLSGHFEKRNKVFVVLKDVELIDYSAIVVLLSIMVKFKAMNLRFNGDFPDNKTATDIIRNSGFFENLTFADTDRYAIAPKKGDGIFTHSSKHVDSALTAGLIKKASQTVWGQPIRRQGVQRSLIELMQNTHNHADQNSEAAIHWWLSVHHDKENRRVSFSFVDYGVGVIRSLENKPTGSKFSGWQNMFKNVLRNNAELLRRILDGELHSTVTGKPFRGKGLPGIKEVMDQNWISNLHVITNDVFANVGAGEYRTLNCSFSGTFIYWDVGVDNLKVGGE